MKRLTLSVALLAFALVATPARAQVPQLVSYQGVLTDGAGNLVPDGLYDITFRFFGAAVGGAVLHDESHIGVAVSRGGFSVLIGSVVGDPLVLPFTIPYWLEIQVAPDALPLTPRIQLASSPYTQMAETVLDNAITTAKLATGAVTTTDILDNTIAAIDIAPDAVGASEIATGGVTTTEILDNTVTSADILANSLQDIDMLDEPGVAFDQDFVGAFLVPQTGVDVTVAAVTITTPAAGFILVSYGGYYFDGAHTLGLAGTLRASISEDATVQVDKSFSIASVNAAQPTGSYFIPISKSAIYSKAAGTYTFNLICDNTGTEDVNITYPVLQALFFSSDYGTSVGGTPQAVVESSPMTRAAAGERR